MDSKPNPKRLQEFLSAKNGNIVSLLEEREVGLIGSGVVKDFDLDYNDPKYQEKKNVWDKGQKLVRQEIETKNFPFVDAANVKYPLMTKASVQFSSRAYPAIVQGNTVVRPKLVGANAQPEAQQEEQPQQQGQTPPQQAQEKPESKIDRAERVCEFINWQLFNEISEWESDTDKLMGMLPLYGSMFRCVHYSQEKNRIVTELLSPEELILPYKAPSLRDASRRSKKFTLYPRQVIERVRGGRYSEAPHFQNEEEERPEQFIEQYKWLDLDEDGFKEPYIVTVHKDSAKCVRIAPNYRMEDIIINDAGEVSRINEVQYFVKYTFIPSTDKSIYDLGFFDLLYPINAVINSVLNQLIDAGTLQNTNSGFISAGLGLRKKGVVAMKPGQFQTVADTGQDIRQSIFQMDWKGPSPTLYSLLGFMVDAGEGIANLKEVLEGEQQTNQTATTTMALIEQGLKVFSAIYKRIHRSLSQELTMIRFWNHEVRNPLYGEVIDKRFTQEDFADDDLDFVPVSDPSVVTDMQKMGRVQFLMQFMEDPHFDQMKLREEIFEGANIEGFDNLKAGQDPEKAELQQQLQQSQQQLQQWEEAYKKLQDTTEFDQKTALMSADDDAALNEAKAKDLTASAIKKIAEAEAVEPGLQLDIYKAEVESLDVRQGNVRGMGSQSGNGGSPQVRNGAPESGNGGMAQRQAPGMDRERFLQALSQMSGSRG